MSVPRRLGGRRRCGRRVGLALVILVTALLWGSVAVSSALAAAPANDNFASAQVISGNSGTVQGTNVGATSEPGEPVGSPFGDPANSVWYSYTAPQNATLSIDLSGSSFDTVLKVYRGSSVDALTEVAANDDFFGSQSRVLLHVTSGQIYRVRVEGYDQAAGNVTLNWVLDPAHITGQVTDATTHDALDGIGVKLWMPDGFGGWSSLLDVSTDASGAYDLGPITPGSYRVGFTDPTGARFSQFYNGAATVESATAISVGTTTVAGIDAALVFPSHITGRVSDAKTHDPLSNIDVRAWGPDGAGGLTQLAITPTDFNGDYDLGGLAAGSYVIQFSDGSGTYCAQYYHHAYVIPAATDVMVGGAEITTGIDAALVTPSHITGHVTDAATHAALSSIAANLYMSNGSGSWESRGGVLTDATGAYDLGGLSAGTYRVGFDSGLYGSQFYAGASTLGSATDIVVGEDETISGIDAATWAVGTSDSTSPDTSISVLPSGWVNHDVVYSLDASDTDSPVGLRTYSWLGASDPATYTAPVTVSSEGSQTLSYFSVDSWGNAETTRTLSIRIDKTAPVTTDNHGAVYIDSALVSLTATDALSGVAKTTWTLDGAVGTGSAVGTSAIGAHVLTYSSTDVAGNIEATKTVRFSVLSATSLAAPTITPRAIKRNQKLTFVSYLKPGAAAAAARTKLYLYHSETKTVTVKVKGKNKKVKVTYWRLRTTLTFKGTSAGKLTATSKLTKSGKWRAQAVYGGSATWAPASSAFKNFTVK